jgi:hypothetical protein
LDITQTTQALNLLFIVKDLKSTYALDESELSLFQLESLMPAMSNNFSLPTLLLPSLASQILSKRLFYFHRGKASLDLCNNSIAKFHLSKDWCLILLESTRVIFAFTAIFMCVCVTEHSWYVFSANLCFIWSFILLSSHWILEFFKDWF